MSDSRPIPLLRVLLLACAAAVAATLGYAPLLGAQTGPAAPTAQAPHAGYDPALFQELRYRMIGPSRGGRVTAVAGHAAHPATFYMGSTGGGVWKSDDYGARWRSVSDGFFETASIGAIRVAPSDPSVVYVGTGSDGLRSNVITGRGVYRSSDAGATWAFVGLRDAGLIGAVEVHPTDPDVAYVAAIGQPFGRNEERGVYRTRDGGERWERVLFVADSIGAVDLELKPDDPSTVYAAMWRGERKPWTIISGADASSGVGIYKSTDAGDSWERLDRGLPDGLVGKIDLAVSPADPERVYALVEAPDPAEGLYRSDDAGRSWRLVSNRAGLMNRPFYYTNVDADPTNADVVYVGNEGFYRSADGGESWERISTPHGDNHDLWINPDDPRIWIQSNDGGANVTLDAGRTWSTQLNQPTAELYQVAVDDRFPYWVYAGQQDNSTIRVPSLPPTSGLPDTPQAWWEQLSGCETGPVVPRPGDASIVYGNCKGRFSVFDAETGQEQAYWVGANFMYGHAARDLEHRFQRVAPIEISPHDPDVIYHASQRVHRTVDGGRSWEAISPDLTARPEGTQGVSGEPITRDITGEEFYSTLYAVEESPLEPGLIWVGSNDGPFHLTRDGGRSWQEATPADLPPGGRVQSIEASPHRPGKAYYAVYRYLLDDWQPYVYRTTDYGQSWTRLTSGENGIPADVPVRVVREDPDREGLLYAGTEFGMYVSFDDGGHWQPLQLNLPVTPVTDLRVHRKDLVASTMGRSFWILDDLTPLHQAADSIAARGVHLYAPREAYRMRYRTWDTDVAANPQYLPAGAVIDYYLAEPPAGELVLEVVDARGQVVRRFSSEQGGEAEAVVQAMRAPRLERAGTPRLETGPGMHRLVWDLRHPGAWSAEARSVGRRGPLAVPGEYELRLRSGELTRSQPLRLRMDPRVEAAGVTRAELEAQLGLNLRIRDAITAARLAAARVEALLADEQRLSPAQRERLRALHAELVTSEEISSYPQPMLIAQLEYLYGMTTSADQRPGRDAFERFAELREQLDRVLAALEQVP